MELLMTGKQTNWSREGHRHRLARGHLRAVQELGPPDASALMQIALQNFCPGGGQ
jgi:hypothetical protein